MKIYKLVEYNNYIDISEEFVKYITNSIINEDRSSFKKFYKEILQKVKSELRLDLGFIGTFSTGITAFAPITEALMKRENIEINDTTILLATVCALTTIYLSYKQDEQARADAKNMLTELKLRGVGNGIIKKLKKVYETSFGVIQTISKYTGRAITTFIDMFSYSALMIPAMNGFLYMIDKYNLTFETFIENTLGLIIGVSAIASKHIFTDFIKKMKKKLSSKDKNAISDYVDDIKDKGFKDEISDIDGEHELIHEMGVKIKTFEELNYKTYSSAAKGLEEKGYNDRAEKLKEKAIDEFFKELFNGMEMYEDRNEYPDYIFFIKYLEDGSKVIYMIQDEEYKWLRCSYDKIWEFLSTGINLSQDEIQQLIKERVDEAFKIRSFTPKLLFPGYSHLVDEAFKIRSFTPNLCLNHIHE